MFSSLASLLVASLALSANAAPGNEIFKRACPRNDCARAVDKSAQPASFTMSRDAACSSFLLTTVSGCATTTTSMAASVTSTSTVTIIDATTTTTTAILTSNAVSTQIISATTTTSIAFAKMKRVPVNEPVTGTVSQAPAACAQATTTNNAAVPSPFNTGCKSNTASFSQACSCVLSTLSTRTTTTGASTVTSVMTPTSVVIVYTTTTGTITMTETTTTTSSATTTTTMVVATQTIQPVSGQFFVSTSEGSTIINGDAASNYALKADMTNQATYFTLDNMSKLMSSALFATLPMDGDVITLTTGAADASKISCACANSAARTGAFTCRSSMGSTLLQLCTDNGLVLAQRLGTGCRAIIATCNAVAAT